MPAFDVTIDYKTYHVDIPWLNAAPLQVIVDGQPLEISIGSLQGVTLRDVRLANQSVPVPEIGTGKPVKAEWHASIRAE